MINWMLEVDDVEDVACRVDDMEATDHSQSLVWRGWSEGRLVQGQGYNAARGWGPTRVPRVTSWRWVNIITAFLWSPALQVGAQPEGRFTQLGLAGPFSWTRVGICKPEHMTSAIHTSCPGGGRKRSFLFPNVPATAGMGRMAY